MAGDRLHRILSKLSPDGGRTLSPDHLGAVSAELTGVSGAGVMLMTDGVGHGSLWTTNQVSDRLEDLQYTLGEGPCVDAHATDGTVLEPDLASPSTPRWLAFTPPAIDAGARAVFAFPLRVGTARLGALDLYRDRPGPLDDHQHADALVLADVIAHWILGAQAGASPGMVAEEVLTGANLRFVVHNAAGMVSVQMGVSVAEALIRLRAYAFSHDRPLTDVAEDVVAHRLRF